MCTSEYELTPPTTGTPAIMLKKITPWYRLFQQTEKKEGEKKGGGEIRAVDSTQSVHTFSTIII